MLSDPFDYLDREIVVSVSGGKDSTALYLLACEELGDGFLPVFADTGHEHRHTLEAVERLSGHGGGPPIQTVRADFSQDFITRRRNIATRWPAQGIKHGIVLRALEAMKPTGNTFLDLCLLRGGFPSAKMRFCHARDLKVAGPITTKTHGIRAAVDWSRTARGGRQYDALGHAEMFGPWTR